MSHRILVAFDESPLAEVALRRTLETYPTAEVVVLHVTDPVEWIVGDGMNYGYYSEEDFERAHASAEELLVRAESIAEAYDRPITTTTAVGRVAQTIVEYAEEHAIDHIVCGSHGRSGLARFLLGSVAETVAKRAPVSVTVIREPTDESAE